MGAESKFKCFAFLAVLALFFKPAHSFSCYQCMSTDSAHPFQCNEYLTSDIDMEPESCDDVYGAQYCVKHIGRFEVLALDCYQCATGEEWKCMDGNLVTSSLQPRNCNHVFEAQYCVQAIGRYGGGIGTKRFCSARDLGNYCDYVQQPGDKLTYRTCVFTCNTDGCNPASHVLPNIITMIVSSLIGLMFVFKR